MLIYCELCNGLIICFCLSDVPSGRGPEEDVGILTRLGGWGPRTTHSDQLTSAREGPTGRALWGFLLLWLFWSFVRVFVSLAVCEGFRFFGRLWGFSFLWLFVRVFTSLAVCEGFHFFGCFEGFCCFGCLWGFLFLWLFVRVFASLAVLRVFAALAVCEGFCFFGCL